MKDIDIAVQHRLSAALGWLELGNAQEALAELERVPPEFSRGAAVLELRWMLYSYQKEWNAALETARELARVAPDQPESWLHHAYAVRRAEGGGLQAAWDILYPALERFPKVAVVPYNLACYACQMGKLDKARSLLKLSMKTGAKKQIKEMALVDRDLEPLWPEIEDYS